MADNVSDITLCYLPYYFFIQVIFLITTIVRTFILYFFVILAVRLMGKRQIGDLQPSELVITLLISEIAAIPLQDTSQPILNGITSIFVLVILEILVSILTLKSQRVRQLLSGKSVVVIKNGVIDQCAMKSVRMTVLDLIELLRIKDVFDISTVAFAVLEVNGELSVLLKSGEQTVTVNDLEIKKSAEFLSLPVISDGVVMTDSLKSLNITRKDLKNQLKGIEIKDVFLMMLDRRGNKNIIRKRDL